MFPTPIEKASGTTRWLYKVALPISMVLWLLPIIAVMLTSIRGQADLTNGNYWGMPSEWMLIENYSAVFQNTPMVQYVLNSFYVTIPTVIGTVVLSTLAGFALGTYRFKLNMVVFLLFVGGNFVPFQILMIPVRELTLKMGMYDSTMGLVMFHIAFQTGFATFFLRNFIRDLPYELIEAARIEGASEWQIFHRVVLPLVRPAVAAVAVLIFTFIWNDYFWATVLIQGDHAMPVTGGLKSLNGQWVAQWQLVSAGSILAAMPPVIIFFLLQKQFIAGLTVGATKG
ncbi:sugar ABC transporter permease [Hydrogenophaga crassostreae]|uniref:Sugar ABC transporter permease n=1 Tax=Hydrogenophaga crassostreae TaxID=1763535 RepID=A0A167GTD1_9BURK|nr:carbohydrate ABC transporter permease [Hydrogenophaga crassostreae]AOW11761.1 sugar ABC transporter permease [Hydrogenophaga crassostreae]OAD39853.1 sugar ABC transporter permease [Hydrogenophaga crassostreae]